jgi:hypothetical protein
LKAKWVFAESGGGERSGFNDAGINTFKNKKVRSVAREVIQNSLDASSTDDLPVEVSVETFSISVNEAPEFFSLLDHMTACADEAQDKEPKEFFSRAQSRLQNSAVNGLLFHDSNTSGLTGPLQHRGPWQALTRSSGVTQKVNGGLGSFGHGARAPFALSGLRTVLYLSEIESDGIRERRAVGRSVLMSHTFDGRERQAVGFFGLGDTAAPMLNGDIPEWLDRLRPKGLGTGTTLIVLDVRGNAFKDKFEFEVMKNYSLALQSERLRVTVLGEPISKEALNQKWEQSVSALLQEDSVESTVDQLDLQIMETILAPENRFTLSTELGECELRIRSDDNVKQRSVTVARGGGMIITSSPDGLRSFPRLRNFSCVVWVKSKEGSSILSKLENPTHTEFSRDWLPDTGDQSSLETWSKYVEFTKAVRLKLKELFEIVAKDTFENDLLDDIVEGTQDGAKESVGAGRVLRLVDNSAPRKSLGTEGRGSAGPSKPTGGSGRTIKPGPRRIPDLTGKDVGTDGWATTQGVATCRSRVLSSGKLLLRAEFPQSFESPMAVLFCAVGANGDVLSLTPALNELMPNQASLEIEIPHPGIEYAIEVVLYKADEDGGKK